MEQLLLEMKNITKEFPGVKALNNVSFSAKKGEILSIVGENGAGKSTLMKVLSGSYPYHSYSGQVFINGQETKFANTFQSEQAGIAMIYQEISMHLELSVAENIFIAHWPQNKFKKIDWKKMERKTVEYLQMMHLDLDPKIPLKNLNTSQMQIVSIVRALTKNPSLLVLDEPTSALTDTEAEVLFKILHKLKKDGITSIFISHKLDEVFEHADRIVVIRDGNVISTNETAQASRSSVIADMVGRDFTSFYPEKSYKQTGLALRVENFTVPHPYAMDKNMVDDVSIDAYGGEILGIAGLVGAGRSELVNAIYGNMPKTSGSVYMHGEKIDIKSPKDAIRNGITLVTEDRKIDGFVGKLDIMSNICLASLKKVSRAGRLIHKKEQEYANRYYKEMDIRAVSVKAIVDTLSGGNQQKVVLSKCLMTDPKVLILDEPTRGIDIASKHSIYELMVRLASEGVSIIMISSELPELISMSDRVVVLSDGKKAGELLKDEISQVRIMELATVNM